VTADVVAAIGIVILLADVIVLVIGMMTRPESQLWLTCCVAAGLIGLGLMIGGGVASSTTGTREGCGVVVLEDEPEYVCVEVGN
jgi:hypothetical protein